MECTQAIDFTQSLIDKPEKCDSLIVAGWVEILGTKYELKQGCSKLGRDPVHCQIILQDQKTISKEHALFEVEDCHVTVCDLGSRNKSKLNHMYLKPQVRYALQGEEKLVFGDVCARFIKNESAEISHSESDTIILSKSTDVDTSDSVYVPETPICQLKPNRIVLESPIPESQDCIDNEKNHGLCDKLNRNDAGIGIVISKMPKLSEDYNSDESTDIEDYLESYKVSQSPNESSRQSLQSNESSSSEKKTCIEDDSRETATPETDDTFSVMISADVFQQQTQIVDVESSRKPVDVNETNESMQVARSCDQQITGESHETQDVLNAFGEEKHSKLNDNCIQSLKQFSTSINPIENVCEEMEASQSLLNEDTAPAQSTVESASEDKLADGCVYNSTDELFSLVKLEEDSEPYDSLEFKLPPTDPCTGLVPESTSNSSEDGFDGVTQISDNATATTPIKAITDFQLTQISDESPRSAKFPRDESICDTTQDVLLAFNENAQQSKPGINRDVDVNNDSTQQVLNAFSDKGKFSIAGVCPIKIRTDLSDSLVDKFDLATQPVSGNTPANSKNTLTDEETMFLMPTQIINHQKKFSPSLPRLPKETNDVFDMPTQCVVSEDEITIPHGITTESPSASNIDTHQTEFDAPTQIIFSKEITEKTLQAAVDLEDNQTNCAEEFSEPTQILNQSDNDLFLAPTQNLIPHKHSIHSIQPSLRSFVGDDDPFSAETQKISAIEENYIPTQNVDGKSLIQTSEKAQLLPLDDEDLDSGPTQNIILNENVEDTEVELNAPDTNDDIYNALTQKIPHPHDNEETPLEKAIENTAKCVQGSKCISSNYDVSDSKEVQSSLSDEDTDVEDFLEQRLHTNQENIADQNRMLDKSSHHSGASPVQDGNMSSPGVETLKQNCLSNSDFKSSCIPDTVTARKDLKTAVTDVASQISNKDSPLHVLSSSKVKPGINISSDVENSIQKSDSSQNECEARIDTERPSSITLEGENISGDNVATDVEEQKVIENIDDFSGFDSSPTKTLSESKTVKIRKAMGISGNRKSRRASAFNRKARIYVAPSSNEGVTEKNATPKDNTRKLSSRSGSVKQDKGTLRANRNKELPETKSGNEKSHPSNNVIPSSDIAKRSTRRSKPPARYSPESPTNSKVNVNKKIPINKDVKVENETVFPVLLEPVPSSSNMGKRSRRMAEQESNIADKRFKAICNVTNEPLLSRSTRQSSRRSVKNRDDVPTADDHNAVAVEEEIESSVLSNERTTRTERAVVAATMRKTRSSPKTGSSMEKVSLSPVNIVKVEDSKQLRATRTRGRSGMKKTSDPGNIKESPCKVLPATGNKIDLMEPRNDPDALLISEISKGKKICDPKEKRTRLKVCLSPVKIIKIDDSKQLRATRTRGRSGIKKTSAPANLPIIKESPSKVLSATRNKIELVEPQNDPDSLLISEISKGKKICDPKEKRTRSKVCLSPVKIVKVEDSKQLRATRTRGRPGLKKTSAPANTKESPSKVLPATDNTIELVEPQNDPDSLLISEISKDKKICDPKEKKTRSRNRKRSLSSVSTESNSSTCNDRRKSARSAAKLNAGTSASVAQNPKVMFTGYKDQRDDNIVKRLGGQLVERAKDCSVLVTTALKRTCKLIAALGAGVTIVSPEWLAASNKAGVFVDTMPFLLSDKESEAKFGFSLLNSHLKALSSPLFAQYCIHATKSVKPPPEEIKEIVECAKGKYLKAAPKSFSENVIIVSCPEDKKTWTTFKKLKLPVVDIEFILTGLLKQEILIDENLLF